MAAHVLLGWVLARWEMWTFPLVGLACAGVGLFVGRSLLGKRRTAARPPAPVPAAAPQVRPDDDDEDGPAEPGRDRRVWPRHKVREVKVTISDAAGAGEPFEGWVVNRSLGGLGISVDQP